MNSNKSLTFYDLHSHFLPGMDDGCKTPEESLALLTEHYRQGCRGIVSTSHYYAQESIDHFLKRREQAAARLLKAMNGRVQALRQKGQQVTADALQLPALTFGAEVAYRDTLVNDPDLEKLCFGKSRYLLLEMPFEPWSERTLRGVEEIENLWGIKVIVAHIERYRGYADDDYIEALMDMDVTVQLNAGNFGRRKTARNAIKLIKNGRIDVFATDSHNVENRPPNMIWAIEALQKKGMDDALDAILANNAHIFAAAKGR